MYLVQRNRLNAEALRTLQACLNDRLCTETPWHRSEFRCNVQLTLPASDLDAGLLRSPTRLSFGHAKSVGLRCVYKIATGKNGSGQRLSSRRWLLVSQWEVESA